MGGASHDTLERVETPEGIGLALEPAGAAVRAAAWAMDAGIRYGILVGVITALTPFGLVGKGLWLLAAFFLEWLYPFWFEARRDGQTPGKRRMGIRVVQGDGVPLTWARSALRNVLRAVDVLPFGYGVGLVSATVDKRFRRLGDLVADSVVVHVPTGTRAPHLSQAIPDPPPFALKPHEQRALLDFSERIPTLPSARAEEIARQAEPLTAGSDKPVARLQGIARWLAGGG